MLEKFDNSVIEKVSSKANIIKKNSISRANNSILIFERDLIIILSNLMIFLPIIV
jgi:hypothetical protein